VNFDKFVSSTAKLGDQLKEGTEKFGRRVRKQVSVLIIAISVVVASGCLVLPALLSTHNH